MKVHNSSVPCYKKPAFWLILLGLAACSGVAVVLLLNPFGWGAKPTSVTPQIVDSNSGLDGVDLVITDITLTGEKPHIQVEWRNSSGHTLVIGEEFYVQKLSEKKWTDCRTTKEYAFDNVGHLIPSSDKENLPAYVASYSLKDIDLTPGGTYALLAHYFIHTEELTVPPKYTAWIAFQLGDSTEPFVAPTTLKATTTTSAKPATTTTTTQKKTTKKTTTTTTKKKTTTTTLSEEAKLDIKVREDFAKWKDKGKTADDYNIYRFMGSYNGYLAVQFGEAQLTENGFLIYFSEKKITYDGIKYSIPTENWYNTYMYKDGAFIKFDTIFNEDRLEEFFTKEEIPEFLSELRFSPY